MHLGLGAAIENLVRASSVYGYAAYVRPVEGKLTNTPPDEPVIAARITMDPGTPSRDPLYEAIPLRHTHRGLYLERQVAQAVLIDLGYLVEDLGVRVVFLDDRKACKDMGDLIVDATQRIVADPAMSAASARWIRTGRRDIAAHRDGVSIDAAGLSPATVMFGKLMPDLGAATEDSYWLANTKDIQVHAPVLGMILVKDHLDKGQAIAAGRAWQRIHLALASAGLAAQPLNQPVECVDRNAQLGRPDTYQNALVKLANAPGWQPTFTFRLGYAQNPAPLSPRRALEDVMKSSGLA
jgi:hypothetical protein